MYGWPFAVAAIGAWGARFAWNRFTTPPRRSPSHSASAVALSAEDEASIFEQVKRIFPPPERARLDEANEQPLAAFEEENAIMAHQAEPPAATPSSQVTLEVESENPMPPAETQQSPPPRVAEARANEEPMTPHRAVQMNINRSIDLLTQENLTQNIKWVRRAGELILAHPKIESEGLQAHWFAQKQKKYVIGLKKMSPSLWARLSWIRIKKIFKKQPSS